LRPADAEVTFSFVPADRFSSSLCDGVMLRHPSDSLGIRLGEGCSSTAIGKAFPDIVVAWVNPANRGSTTISGKAFPAVP
jgi:hypothetical protein